VADAGAREEPEGRGSTLPAVRATRGTPHGPPVSSPVTRLETFTLRAPIQPRRGVSIASASEHGYLLVRLEDVDGAVGWGETYLVTGVEAAVEAVRPLLLGRSPDDQAVLVHEIRTVTEHAYATSALAIALDDLRARRAGLPLAALYGGVARSTARAYAASGGYREGEATADTWQGELDAALGAGFSALKLRIGRDGVGEEGPHLRRLAAAAPDGFLLLADGNGGFSHPRAVAMGSLLAELDFGWFEEPMRQWDDYAGYGRLRADLRLPLAGGEILMSRSAARGLLATGGVDIVQPEPVICGGVGEALFIAALAALDGVVCLPHTSNGAIGIAAAMTVVAALPVSAPAPGEELPLLEWGLDENPWRTDVAALPPIGVKGWVTLPNGPGLGIEVDEALVRRSSERSSR
jgi:D-galactarolactone cycloisomerase